MVKQQEIRALTGLRGIAALYVIMYHFKAYSLFGDILNPFFVHGYLAVDIFFVLSGFVMALTYKSLFDGKISFSAFRKFIARRIARVYPLYFVMTGIFLAIFLIFPKKAPADMDFSAALITSNFLMIQSWGISSSIVGPGWSISTEFAAYILFPILAVILLFRKIQLSHAIALLCLIIIAIISYIPIDLINHAEKRGPLDLWDGRSLASVIRCLCEFSLGLWAYRIYSSIGQTEQPCLNILGKNIFSIFIWALFVICLTIKETDVFIVFLLPFMIITLCFDKNTISKILAWPPIYYLGLISYSLYLCHVMSFWIKSTASKYLVAFGIEDVSIIVFILQIFVSITLATIFYFAVEKPGRTYFKKILG